MTLTMRPDSHYSDKAPTRNSTKTEEEHNFLETRKKNNRSATSGPTNQTNPDIFLYISVLFCPVHVGWTAAVKCLYRVAHRLPSTRRNMLNIEGQVTFTSPCKMGQLQGK